MKKIAAERSINNCGSSQAFTSIRKIPGHRRTTAAARNEIRLDREYPINAAARITETRFEYRTSPHKYPGSASSRLMGP